MVALSKISKYTKAGILLMLFGLLVLAGEDVFLDESLLLETLYLLPICCFISSSVAFYFDARYKTNN
jgi:hypothetical protein